MSKYYATSLWLTGAYFLTGWLGLMMPAVGTAVTLLWLPTGIAVAVLYRSGYRHWPAVTIGAILVNLVSGQSLALAVGISIGNTLGPMLAVWLLQQLRFDARFERNRDIAILAAAGHAGMAVSASGGVAVLFLSGLPRHEVFNVWMYWWAGDSMGVIAAAPLLLVASRSAFRSIRIRYREFAGWLLLLFVISGCVFVVNREFTNPALPLAFVPLAVIPWGTMRFGTMGTSLAVILISFVAVYGTSSESGPFFRADASDQILLLWIYMATTATLGWSVAALQLAQARATSFQLILEKALSEVSLGVLMTDNSQNVTYMNTGFTSLTGYEESDLLRKNCRILQGKETDRSVVAKVKSEISKNGHFDGEILNYRKDGTPFWNALLITEIHNDAGEQIGFLGIQRDVTAKKDAELALRQSEAHLRSILDLEPDCVKVVSPSGRLMEMNAAGLAMIEAASIEQVRGAQLEELIIEEHRSMFRRMHQQVLAGQAGHLEFAIRGLKGTLRWLESRCVPYRSTDGEITGLLGVTRDVTTRRQVEVTMRESRNRLNSILNSISEVVYSASVSGDGILFMSDHAMTLYGRPASDFIAVPNLRFSVIHADDQNAVNECLQTLNEKGEHDAEYRIIRPDGGQRWVRDRGQFMRDDAGIPIRLDGVISDITESRKIEAEIRASLREKEAMLKEIHHRVKNNLQIVSSLLNLQIERVSDSLTLDALRENQNRVRSMALVHETLYRSGNLGRIDLTEYLNALCSHLFRSFGVDPSMIHLTLNVVNTSLDLERAIPLGLITNELVSNALKYAFPPERSGVIRVDFEITSEDSYKLVVADDGIGLPDSFDLNQLKSIGLQLTGDLVQQLSGNLTIVHAPGTTFHVSFPLFPAEN